MAEEVTQFVEVTCVASGKTRRFSAGTNAGFAVNLINRKLETGAPRAFYVEAVKEGEESVSFGPNSLLVDYGRDWKLQTVTEIDFAGVGEEELVPPVREQVFAKKSSENSLPAERVPKPKKTPNTTLPAQMVSKPGVSLEYIGKIILAFILIFMIAGFFTLALENLPSLILLINNSLSRGL